MTTTDTAPPPVPDRTDPSPTPAAKGDAKADAAAQREAMRTLLAPVRGRTLLAMAMQVVASAATVVPYIGIAELGRTLLADGPVDRSRVLATVWLVLGALGVRALLGGGALAVTHFADVKMQAILRRRIVATLGAVPLGWFTRNSSGLVRKATHNDIGDLHYAVAHRNVETVAGVATPLFAAAYVFWLDWRLGLLALATLPIYAVAYAIMTRDLAVRMAEMNAGIAAIGETIVEFVSGIAVVKTFGQVGQAHGRYRTAAADFGEAYGRWVQPMLRTDALASMAISAPVVLLVNLAGGTWFLRNGWVDVVDVVTAALVAMALPAAVITLGFGMQARREAAAAARRIADLLATPGLRVPANPQVPDGDTIVFDGVSFSYDGTNKVLDDIDLVLAAGTVTALVGPSGSGKSTLATLVPRFHDPDTGSVRIGGVDIRDIEAAELYRRVGFVLQDVQLLGTSILDNIRLARPGASLDEVRAAARAARIDDRIVALPRGYDSVVGVDARLSGGEAQRVSIARAILADTPILVLDEATAFADPESEAEIQDALSNLTRGRTLLVIAHRLSSIVGADRIVVLDRGRVVQCGSHTELVDRPGAYRRMWQHHTATPDTPDTPGTAPAAGTGADTEETR